MAAQQTRRSISVPGVVYDRLMRYAAQHDQNAAQVVVDALRRLGIPMPETKHERRIHVARAAATKQHKRILRAGERPKLVRIGSRKLIAPRDVAVPSTLDLQRLRALCDARVPNDTTRNAESRLRRQRQVSLVFAEEMRKRGWIAEEGYAPGSWADPKNAARAA